MSADLKPCPFCGNTEPTIADLSGWETWCKKCGCSGPAGEEYLQEKPGDRSAAAAAWNRRAAPDAPAVQAEPVGYAVMVDYNGNGKWVRFGDLHCTERSADAVAAKYPQDGTIRVLPVYTHPPAADPVADKLAEALRAAITATDVTAYGAAIHNARAALAEWEEQKGGV